MSQMQYMPGDPRLVDQLVYELKSKGIFDQFRKECIADVDTRPAYQNLRQRVETSVGAFLSRQQWRPDLNKNQLREKLRKHILDGNYLEQGVERIVDQVVNPKVASVFIPQVEDLVYNYLGIPRKKPATETTSDNIEDLLPTDLEAVSPGSVKSNDGKNYEKEEEKMEIVEEKDDSVMFVEEIKEDTRLSGISELTINDSEVSMDKSNIPLPTEEIKLENIPAPENSPPNIKKENIDLEKINLPREPNLSTDIPLPGEVPKVENDNYFKPMNLRSEDDDTLSDSDGSLIRNVSPLTPIRNFNNENSCDAQQGFENDLDDKSQERKEQSSFRFTIEAKSEENSVDATKVDDIYKRDDSQCHFSNKADNTFNTTADEESSNSNNLQIDYESDINSKATGDIKLPEAENSEDSKKDKKEDRKSHQSSHKSRDSHRSKDNKKDSKSSRDSSRHGKKSKERDSKSHKDKTEDKKDNKDSKHRSSSHKSSHKDSKHRSSSSSKHSSQKDDRKDDKKDERKDDKKVERKDDKKGERKSSSSSKDRTSRDKDRSNSKSSSHRSDKDKKRSDEKENRERDKKKKKETDDHYSLSGRGNPKRRSTDRDSNDGSSSSKSSQNPNAKSAERKGSKSTSKSVTSTSSNSDSPSDKEIITNQAKTVKIQPKPVRVDNLDTPLKVHARLPFVPDVTMKKPRFASNMEEAKKMVKMRKFYEEEQKRMNQEAALLLEFQANVRPSLSKVYSSIPGPELEIACVNNAVQPTTKVIKDGTIETDVNESNIVIETVQNDADMDTSYENENEISSDIIAESLLAMHREHGTKQEHAVINMEQSVIIEDFEEANTVVESIVKEKERREKENEEEKEKVKEKEKKSVMKNEKSFHKKKEIDEKEKKKRSMIETLTGVTQDEPEIKSIEMKTETKEQDKKTMIESLTGVTQNEPEHPEIQIDKEKDIEEQDKRFITETLTGVLQDEPAIQCIDKEKEINEKEKKYIIETVTAVTKDEPEIKNIDKEKDIEEEEKRSMSGALTGVLQNEPANQCIDKDKEINEKEKRYIIETLTGVTKDEPEIKSIDIEKDIGEKEKRPMIETLTGVTQNESETQDVCVKQVIVDEKVSETQDKMEIVDNPVIDDNQDLIEMKDLLECEEVTRIEVAILEDADIGIQSPPRGEVDNSETMDFEYTIVEEKISESDKQNYEQSESVEQIAEYVLETEAIDTAENVGKVQDIETSAVTALSMSNVTVEDIEKAALTLVTEDSELPEGEIPLEYFAEHEKFNSELEKVKFEKFLKTYVEKVSTSRLILLNCDRYGENLLKDVAQNLGNFHIVTYHKNGLVKLPKPENKVIKNVTVTTEVVLPTNSYTNQYSKNNSPIFSPRSECSFELCSDYDTKLEEMVNKTSRKEIMEIILGGFMGESSSEDMNLDYGTDSHIEKVNTEKPQVKVTNAEEEQNLTEKEQQISKISEKETILNPESKATETTEDTQKLDKKVKETTTNTQESHPNSAVSTKKIQKADVKAKVTTKTQKADPKSTATTKNTQKVDPKVTELQKETAKVLEIELERRCSEESGKRKIEDVETSNNNKPILTPNKMRKVSESDQISSTTQETEVVNKFANRSKYLGKAKRVGLPKPKKTTIISPSSDKSVENYSENPASRASPSNGKIKPVSRAKVQRYDTSDLYKPKLHYLSRRNNVT